MRLLLMLTVLSVSGWSQPVQQQAQPPIVVQVQMPPTNPWVHFVELVVPGIIGAGLGAGLTLYGVRQTNRYHAAENLPIGNINYSLRSRRLRSPPRTRAKIIGGNSESRYMLAY